MTTKRKTFALGQRVAYARPWLKSTQAHHLGRIKGTVVAQDGMVVGVQWDGSPYPTKCLDCNLVLVSRMHLEAM